MRGLSFIVLIPKVLGLEFVSQFRLISLCTVPYKVFTRVIVNRLRPIIPMLIAENQASFVGERHILNNIIIA